MADQPGAPKPPGSGIFVTVLDSATGDEQTLEIPADDYVLPEPLDPETTEPDRVEPPLDPLADVFPGTFDAPLPRWVCGPNGTSPPRLRPARTDQRWAPVPAEPKDGGW